VRNGRCYAADFIDGLPLRSQKKLVRLIETVTAFENGPFDLRNEQKFKHVGEDIFELKSDQVRLLLFIEERRRLVVTHGSLKKTQRTPPAEIARARGLMREYRQEVRG